MSYETILFEVDQGVATITLNRPERLNAFNDQMLHEATDAFSRSAQDKAIRCVVLTGSGRGFSAGQDLTEVQSRSADFSFAEHLRESYHRLIKGMRSLEKPVIGAINGIAAGAGCGVALATDVRIASETASFMLAFSKVGLIPDSGTNWFLPRLVGYARAYEMAVTADRIAASQALAWGMVNRVVPSDQLPQTATAWALSLASGATLAFGLTKRAMNRSWQMDLDEALLFEAELQEVAGRSQDYSEGVKAFREKRPAHYRGE